MAERFRQMPFLSYAARYWGIHIQDAEMERNLEVPINKLLDNDGLRSSSFQALQYRERIKDPDLAAALFDTLPKGHQPLHVVAYWNLASTARSLLARGEKTSFPDSQGWSPLHWACSYGSLATASILISGGADINARDSHGWTPLFWAAFKGHLTVVQTLLGNCASHTFKDDNGWTVLDWAAERSQQEAAEALIKYHSSFLKDIQQRPKVPIKTLSFDKAKEYEASTKIKTRMGQASVFNASTEIQLRQKDVTIFDMLTADRSMIAEKYFKKNIETSLSLWTAKVEYVGKHG
jgi:ankyrin repeat protein